MTVHCNICLLQFADYKVQNPNYCCSIKLCVTCFKRCESCPQCRRSLSEPYRELSELFKDHIDWSMISRSQKL